MTRNHLTTSSPFHGLRDIDPERLPAECWVRGWLAWEKCSPLPPEGCEVIGGTLQWMRHGFDDARKYHERNARR